MLTPKVKIHYRKSTSESQKLLSEVDFRKSKIFENQLSEVKKYFRKSTFGSQKTFRN